MTALLDGVRVVSAAEQYPGPYATLLLADVGADVVIVERPPGGDVGRTVAPAFLESLNRGKRSVALDLKSAGGGEAMERLLSSADVFLEGFRPGVMNRLSFGWERARTLNPRLVYVSISGFGQNGPAALWPGHDITYAGMAGLLDGRLETRVGEGELPLGDIAAAMFAALAAPVGLVGRERDGVGRHLDVAMLDSLISWMTPLVFAAANGRRPDELPRSPGYGAFKCADGRWLTLSVAHEDHFWCALCQALGIDEYAKLSRAQRVARREPLRAAIRDAVATRARADWEVALRAADVPSGPVNGLPEAASDPQVIARGMIVAWDEDGSGRRYVRQPMIVDGAAPRPRSGVPGLGEHTRALLSELGLADAGIEALVASGAAVKSDEQ